MHSFVEMFVELLGYFLCFFKVLKFYLFDGIVQSILFMAFVGLPSQVLMVVWQALLPLFASIEDHPSLVQNKRRFNPILKAEGLRFFCVPCFLVGCWRHLWCVCIIYFDWISMSHCEYHLSKSLRWSF